MDLRLVEASLGGQIPQNDRTQILPLRQQAVMHVQRKHGFSMFCLVQCAPFVLAWMITVCDFALTLWLNCQDKSRITVAFHDGWEWEAWFLVAEAGIAMCIICATGGIVASRVSVPVVYKLINGFCLSAVAGLNIGWLLHEMYRGHYPEYKIWKVSNSKSMMSDLEGDFGVVDGHKVPPWMDKIQTMSNCCGVDSFWDWERKFEFTSIPDSCCSSPRKDCGKEFFKMADWMRPDVVEEGCAQAQPEVTSMNYQILNLLIVVKSLETILIVSAELIWLFCFITEYPELEIQTRRQTLIPDHPEASFRLRINHRDGKDPNQKVICTVTYPKPHQGGQDEFGFEMSNKHPKNQQNYLKDFGSNMGSSPAPTFPISTKGLI